MAVDMENWFDNMDENTAQPSAFGFEDGITDAVLTEVSLFQSKSSSWTAVKLTFEDSEGTSDDGYLVSVSQKKTDGSKLSSKAWQSNVFQLMRPLILFNKEMKKVVDLDTIRQGNQAVVEALQPVADKKTLKVKILKETPEAKEGETAFSKYTFLDPIDVPWDME